jgi:hypothetical protein
VGEPCSPHCRLILVVHPTGISDQEPSQQGSPALQWAETIEHPIMESIAEVEHG